MKFSDHIKNIFNLKICLILLLVSFFSLWGVYKLTFKYISSQAYDAVQSVLLDHRGIHRYVQENLIASYFRAQKKGFINDKWYNPVMLSSSYIIRNQHKYYNEERVKEGLKPIYYKLAAINPRNPMNKANKDEQKIIEMFRRNPKMTRNVHIDVENGELYYHVSIPFLRNNAQCLHCHGKREDAPSDLQKLYPGQGGFNEKIGELRAITALKVPMGDESLIVFIVLVVFGIMLLFVSTLILFNLSMRRQVNKEVNSLEEANAERQRLQARLNQVQKMEAIGTLAGGIAHDFNNILSVILGYSEILKYNIKDPLDQENIDQLVKAGNRGAQLVKQILCFSRQSEGEATSLKIGPHVKEIMKMLRASIPTTIEFNIEIHDDESRVFADPGHIHQIVTNLCTNAYHAMQQKKAGVLTVKLTKTEKGKEILKKHPNVNPGELVQLTVKDTGYGISKDAIERIFEPYFTTKPVGEGTGMGLSIVHGIVDKYGGYISVESDKGIGTTFNVFFPLFKGDTDESEKNDNNVSYKGQGHILVVDDEKSLVDVISRMLSSMGYNVTTRTDSEEALNLFKNTPGKFDLIFTDQTMPKLNGFDMALKILEISPDKPIILCSGYNTVVNEDKVLKAGIKAFIQKPFTKDTIAQILKEVLEN